ncbi:MAG: hydrogenase [Chloroflexi bacterium]|nr:hydrogenase [Chloroflexota bacterium]
MPGYVPTIASQLLQALGVVLILTAFWMLAARRLTDYLQAYAVQSIGVALVAAVVGVLAGSLELLAVAGLTVLVKVLAITGILSGVARRLSVQRDVRTALNLPTSLLIGVALVVLAFLVSPSVVAPSTFLDELPLAISLALVLIGLFLISSRRHVLAQVVGLLTIENGLFSGAVAIADGMPFIVELGILFDVLVAVIVLGLLVTMIHRHIVTADTAELRRLRG